MSFPIYTPTSDSTTTMSKQQLRRSSRFAPPLTNAPFGVTASNATGAAGNNSILKSTTLKRESIDSVPLLAGDVESSCLPLYTLPNFSGKSHTEPSAMAHRSSKYVEKHQMSLLPKIASLASHLISALESKLNGAPVSSRYYGTTAVAATPFEEEEDFTGLLSEMGTSAATPSLPVVPLKSVDRLQESVGSGQAVLKRDLGALEGKEATEAHTRIGSIYTINNRINVSRTSEDGGCKENCVILPSHHNVVTTEMTLMDMEADFVLDSIRNGVHTPGSIHTVGNFTNTTAFESCPQQLHDMDDDVRSVVSYGSEDDDDGMRCELQKLQDVVARLQHDLAGANPFDLENLSRGVENVGGVQVLEQNNVLIQEESNSLWSAATAELAMTLKSWRALSRLMPDSGSLLDEGWHAGRSGANVTVNPATLYWAIASLWTIVILLAGHSHFDDNGREYGSVSMMWESWREILDLIWRR